jgi:sulfatase maturation enzyme AslB (radical SAM superfamily)
VKDLETLGVRMSPTLPVSGDVRPVRPRTLNFQVNDICNARCVMCNVWQHKRGVELTPADLASLLADPYFSEVEHVGITGGEPTLRRDLADYYRVLLSSCPKLTGASFITHGLDTERILQVYGSVAEAYRVRGLAFHGMVSIDGVGAVHDRVRGRAHAFDRATRTLFGLKASGIHTVACCTIVKTNVWGLWDLLEWGFDKTYIRFRVGEFINRLGNTDRTDEIRAFDEAERSELISFFHTLIQSYETDETVQRTYASIVSLLSGGERLVGCPYQDGRALNLDCRGQFALCAPKGTPHPLGSSPAMAVAAVDDERRAIRSRHCSTCIHDYHDDWRPEVAQEMAAAMVVEHALMADPA